jgi:hypothetical protein
MDNELIPYEETEESKNEEIFNLDIEGLPEPIELPTRTEKGRKSTGAVFQTRLNEALELILYNKLSAREFRVTYSKMYGVSERTADTVWAKCKLILKERFDQKSEELISEQLGRYQDLLIRARQDGNKRVERETLWDISRIMGLDQRKIDITSNGEKLDIKINLSNARD